eukprot:CAMPEP_0173109838 /NCGR_PEP_ID=MMETSP1102-20130122/43815_1 /TAXON_ID=49646 /ORGANISM="Geminigera sp., Strain Caron Lab Isolate" /LENGTH=72 /DNA_ID=CAMNT_0014009103 /DNA_START=521 /DNA_END=739 /DNA_ORIENTATION=-
MSVSLLPSESPDAFSLFMSFSVSVPVLPWGAVDPRVSRSFATASPRGTLFSEDARLASFASASSMSKLATRL